MQIDGDVLKGSYGQRGRQQFRNKVCLKYQIKLTDLNVVGDILKGSYGERGRQQFKNKVKILDGTYILKMWLVIH